jgi:adenylate kinase
VVVLLFGPPGSGKGTQSSKIVQLLDIPAISTGEMLRAERDAASTLGEIVKSILASGKLVSDDIVNQVLTKRLCQSDVKNGFLLDGYPRTVTQAEFLDALLERRGFPPPVVFYLDVPREAILTRISARRQCPKCKTIYNLMSQPPKVDKICDLDGTRLVVREDDRPEVVIERLRAYDSDTGPVLDYYRAVSGNLHRIDGSQSPDRVSEAIESILHSLEMGALVARARARQALRPPPQ